MHTTPTESLSTGLIYYNFLLDNPAAAGENVTSDNVANELDWYADWAINDNFMLSLVLAVADPNDAMKQSSGRTDTFTYGMVYLAYSF